MLVACSGDSAVGPRPVAPQGVGPSITGQQDVLNMIAAPRHHLASFYSCPRHGSIEYVSDINNGAVYVYVGKFAGQSPCGQITSGLYEPLGLFVDSSTHDLYVANTFGENVVVFHRGQSTPYNSYSDPTGQQVFDVRLAKDG